MPLFPMALLDGFFSNGSHRSLAVCSPRCYFKGKGKGKGKGNYGKWLLHLSSSVIACTSGRSATSLHSQGAVASLLPLLFSREYVQPFILCYFSANTTGFLILFFLFSKINIYLLMWHLQLSVSLSVKHRTGVSLNIHG